MLHSFTLLIATLAVTALAAPTPLRNLKPFGKSGAKDVHAFKASSRGHGHHGRRNPRVELSRIYNKFHWSVSLSTLDGWLDLSFPSSASSSDQGSGYGTGYGSGSGSSSGSDSVPSYGSGNGSDSGSAGGSDSPPNVYSTEIVASSAATAPPSYTTATFGSDAASLNPEVSFTQAATTTASAAATGSPSGSPSNSNESGEVTASPEENESEYLSPVTIGGQKLNLNFDTGSADL